VVLVTHIPFFSIFPALQNGSTQAVSSSVVIANSKQVLDFCADYNIKLILQGHLHVVEDHRYKGTQYITSGAVCGNWWKGVRKGHPEGFAVYTRRFKAIRLSGATVPTVGRQQLLKRLGACRRKAGRRVVVQASRLQLLEFQQALCSRGRPHHNSPTGS